MSKEEKKLLAFGRDASTKIKIKKFLKNNPMMRILFKITVEILKEDKDMISQSYMILDELSNLAT